MYDVIATTDRGFELKISSNNTYDEAVEFIAVHQPSTRLPLAIPALVTRHDIESYLEYVDGASIREAYYSLTSDLRWSALTIEDMAEYVSYMGERS